jgi:hypothetical protein
MGAKALEFLAFVIPRVVGALLAIWFAKEMLRV